MGCPLVLLLRNVWMVMHDLQHSTDCPNEITEDESGVVTVNKDDFLEYHADW